MKMNKKVGRTWGRVLGFLSVFRHGLGILPICPWLSSVFCDFCEKISKTHLTTGKGFDIIAKHLARGAAARENLGKNFFKNF